MASGIVRELVTLKKSSTLTSSNPCRILYVLCYCDLMDLQFNCICNLCNDQLDINDQIDLH